MRIQTVLNSIAIGFAILFCGTVVWGPKEVVWPLAAQSALCVLISIAWSLMPEDEEDEEGQ